MITIDKLNRLYRLKGEELEREFNNIFLETAKNNLVLFELDSIVEKLVLRDYKGISNLIDSWTRKAKEKTLEALETGVNDPVYEDRYRKMKELDNLVTYYLEEI